MHIIEHRNNVYMRKQRGLYVEINMEVYCHHPCNEASLISSRIVTLELANESQGMMRICCSLGITVLT